MNTALMLKIFQKCTNTKRAGTRNKNNRSLGETTEQGCTQPRGREQGKTQTINTHQLMREEEIGAQLEVITEDKTREAEPNIQHERLETIKIKEETTNTEAKLTQRDKR